MPSGPNFPTTRGHAAFRPTRGTEPSAPTSKLTAGLARGHRPGRMRLVDALAIAVLIVLVAVPLAIAGVMFVWAAIRDGEEDRAIQQRLGIRRKTRLGR